MEIQIPGEVSSFSATPQGAFVFFRVGSIGHYGIKAKFDNMHYVAVLAPGHQTLDGRPGLYAASAVDGRICFSIPEAFIVPIYKIDSLDIGFFNSNDGMIAVVEQNKYLILQSDYRQRGYLNLSTGELVEELDVSKAAWITEWEIRRRIGSETETLFSFPKDFRAKSQNS